MKKNIIFLFVAALMNTSGFAQGFINLNFENVTLVTYPLRGAPFVYASNAIPAWTPYYGGGAADFIASNGVTGGGELISIDSINNPYGLPLVEGSYFLLLQAAGFGHVASAAIGQTAQIPLIAKSLLFSGNLGEMQVTFGGQPLSFNTVGSVGIYSVYTADISAYAGQVGQLLFLNPSYNTLGIIDSIQFSSTAVPEPGTLALVALGASLLGLRRRRNSREF